MKVVKCAEKKNTCRKSTSKPFPVKRNDSSGSESDEDPCSSDYEEPSKPKCVTKKLTEEQIVARRRKNALSLKERRKQMTPEQKELQKAQDLMRKRRAKAALTPEEKLERRKKATLYMKELRQRKSPEETRLRRLKDLERKKAGKSNLTEEQNEIRRRRNRDFMRVRRAMFSAEEAVLVREQNRVRTKERRKKESPSDKGRHLFLFFFH